MTERRVALIAGAGFYVGPDLARLLAERGHDLVLGDPHPSLVAELESAGTAVEVVTGSRDLAVPGAAQRLVDAGLARFGRIDSATAFTGLIVTGRFMNSSVDDYRAVMEGCMVAPYEFMKAVLVPMIAQEDGQVLVITSASAARATPGAPLYSSARAGATHLVRNVAQEVSRNRVQVNAVGTNFMDFPEFLAATGATDPGVREVVESKVPMRRLGTMEEFAAFAMAFLDGSSGFTTGQFVAYAGGWA